MSTPIPLPDPAGAPAVPPRVRTWAYFIGLGAAAGGSTAISITAIVAPGSALMVAGIVGAVLSGIGMVAHGLGVVYRPSSLTGR